MMVRYDCKVISNLGCGRTINLNSFRLWYSLKKIEFRRRFLIQTKFEGAELRNESIGLASVSAAILRDILFDCREILSDCKVKFEDVVHYTK